MTFLLIVAIITAVLPWLKVNKPHGGDSGCTTYYYTAQPRQP
jgi:hypothetical protein